MKNVEEYRNFVVQQRSFVEKELGVPLSEKEFQPMFNMAWEEGHSNGYEEVHNYLSNLIEVIRPFVKRIYELKKGV